MKSIHITTQDRPILNAIDNTSNALRSSITLAKPVAPPQQTALLQTVAGAR